MTRARENLTITYSPWGGYPASRFLHAIQADCDEALFRDGHCDATPVVVFLDCVGHHADGTLTIETTSTKNQAHSDNVKADVGAKTIAKFAGLHASVDVDVADFHADSEAFRHAFSDAVQLK